MLVWGRMNEFVPPTGGVWLFSSASLVTKPSMMTMVILDTPMVAYKAANQPTTNQQPTSKQHPSLIEKRHCQMGITSPTQKRSCSTSQELWQKQIQ